MAVAAEIALDIEPPSELLIGPTEIERLVLVDPLVFDELDKLVFFASRSIIVMSKLNAGSSSSSITLLPGDPANFVIDVPASKLIKLKPLLIINSTSAVEKSPTSPDMIV